MAPSSALIGKIKVQLKLSISRLRMVQQKDEAIAKQQRRAMAQLLEQGKTESARIRVENIIRSDLTSELYEILELYCELLLARAGLLESSSSSSTCDPGLEEAVKSIMHAAPRTEIKELHAARQLLVEKYGKEFALAAMENADGKQVAERVVRRLRVEPPSEELVEGYLREIARTYAVRWPPEAHAHVRSTADGDGGAEGDGNSDDDDDDDDHPSTGEKERIRQGGGEGGGGGKLETPLSTEELAKATPPRDIAPRSPVRIAPPSPSTDNLSPRVRLPAPPELKPGSRLADAARKAGDAKAGGGVGAGRGFGDMGGGGGGLGNANEVSGPKKTVVPGKVPDVDELAKRFAALKK